jgi:hypothetical protein
MHHVLKLSLTIEIASKEVRLSISMDGVPCTKTLMQNIRDQYVNNDAENLLLDRRQQCQMSLSKKIDL